MLYIQETYVNKTENHLIGETDVYEAYSNNVGGLFKSLRKIYGRCVSGQYIDMKGKTIRIGWVFEKRQKYEDCNETYLSETWVSLHDGPPEKSTTYKYHEI